MLGSINNFLEKGDKSFIFNLKFKKTDQEGQITFAKVPHEEFEDHQSGLETGEHDDSSSEASSMASISNFAGKKSVLTTWCCPICMIKISHQYDEDVALSNICILQKLLQKPKENVKKIVDGGDINTKFKDQYMHTDCFIILIQELYSNN